MEMFLFNIAWIFVLGICEICLISASLISCKSSKKAATATTNANAGTTTPTPDAAGEKKKDAGAKNQAGEKQAGSDDPAKSAKIPEDTDLKSHTKSSAPAPQGKSQAQPPAAGEGAAAPEEVKPMSTLVQAGNDQKFISKGNGVFVDKNGNPISQFAQPPPKDSAG